MPPDERPMVCQFAAEPPQGSLPHGRWADTLARWGQRLGELMTKDMAYATKYGELFADPHHGRFATAQGSATGISELLTLVPDHDTYERIFWHLAVASQHGVDTRSVLPEYGLDIGKSADLVVLDSASPESAVAELTPVLYAFKRGRKTVSRQPAMLHRPH